MNALRAMFARAYRHSTTPMVAGVAATAAALSMMVTQKPLSAEEESAYTGEEVAEHDGLSGRSAWVSYRGSVYDITNFLPNHPGGVDMISMARGKRLELYPQHTNKPYVLEEVLAPMRIGRLIEDESSTTDLGEDPYSSDPPPHPAMLQHSVKPLNLEPPPQLLGSAWLTPSTVFFVRNHHPVPQLSADDYMIRVEHDGKAIDLSLDDVKRNFPKQKEVVTIQCGGNRRKGFEEAGRAERTLGTSWGVGAISTAEFGGARLVDVLQYAYSTLHGKDNALNRVSAEEKGVLHIKFESIDGLRASIPATKALDELGGCLLAYEMNAEPLPPKHGFPLRVVVPGVVGVRNVKWLKKLEFSREEAEGTWQRGVSYKPFSPSVTSFDGIDLETIPSIQETPVTSAILSPLPGASVEVYDGATVPVRGYAFSGGGRGIIRIDVSCDAGKTWTAADITDGGNQPRNRAWAWVLWEAEVPVPAEGTSESMTVMCRATDSSMNVQVEKTPSIWNLRGLVNNSFHQVVLKLEREES